MGPRSLRPGWRPKAPGHRSSRLALVPSTLPRSSPVEQQVDPAGILAFLDALDARPDIEMHSFMLVRHGQVVAEGWWRPYSAERRHLLYSLSKSFTSTAAAFAVAEGLLGLDDTVISHFPEFEADITDPRQSVDARPAHRRDGQRPRARDAGARPCERDPASRFAASCSSRPTARRAPSSPTTSPARTRSAASSSATPGMPLTRLPATAAVRSARHRRGRLAGAPGRSRAGLHRPARARRTTSPGSVSSTCSAAAGTARS